jgi:hypothetical protein
MFEIEIRYYVGTSYDILCWFQFSDWNQARNYMRRYNDDYRYMDMPATAFYPRTEACGPWPLIGEERRVR